MNADCLCSASFKSKNDVCRDTVFSLLA